jgi:hypothetical protein
VIEPLLDIRDDLASIGLVPAAIEVLGRDPELDDEVARQVLRFELASLLLPEPEQGRFVFAHNDSGVGTSNEATAIRVCRFPHIV